MAVRGMIDAILETYRVALGRDFEAYRNHCGRVARFCNALLPARARDPEKIAIAAAFHDLGIWTARTWDYVAPSVDLALAYLAEAGRADWSDEIVLAIREHHKITSVRDAPWPIVEAFRRADLADVSCGLLRSGLAVAEVRDASAEFPNAGFRLRLVQIGCAGAIKRPLRPLPMMKW